MDEQERSNMMREGIAAAQAGERERAYAIFSQLTEDDYNNANAWIWLSATSDDPTEALAAARQALAIEPDNEFAQQAERLASEAQAERTHTAQLAGEAARIENAEEATVPIRPKGTGNLYLDEDATVSVGEEANLPFTEPETTPPPDPNRDLIPPFLAQTTAVPAPTVTSLPAYTDTPLEPAPASRLEARSAVQADAKEIEAEQRRQTLRTIGIVALGVLIVGLLAWGIYALLTNPNGLYGTNNIAREATTTPTNTPPPPTIPPYIRLTQTAVAQGNATATAQGDLANATATAQAIANNNVDATFAAQTFPTSTPSAGQAAYQSGLAAYNNKQYADAAAQLEQAVQLDRTLVLAHYYLGLSDLQLAQAPVGGSAPLVMSATLTISSAKTTPTAVVTLIPPGPGTPAIPPTATSLPPTSTPDLNAPSSADYYARAAIAFRNVTSLSPTWAGGYAGLADTYLRQSRYQEALAPAQQAVNLDGNRPEFHLLLGRVYEGMGMLGEAQAEYDAAANLAPPPPGSTPRPTRPPVTASPTRTLVPTSTPIPTATPLPPTETPLPPTDTPVIEEAPPAPPVEEQPTAPPVEEPPAPVEEEASPTPEG